MRQLIAISAFLLLAGGVSAGNDIRLVFADASQRLGRPNVANLDLGVISHGASRQQGGTRVTKRIRVVAETDAKERRTARLSAWTDGTETRCRVRINGIALSAVPVVVDPMMPVGVGVEYTIELEVPRDASAGALAEAITWNVETH